MTVFERFARHVNITDSCWLWEGSCFANGYGYFDNQKAHRVSYEFFIGPFPVGLVTDHLCRNKVCVNPSHLEAVTQRENAWRGKLREMHGWGECPHGLIRKRDCYTCREVYRTRYLQKLQRTQRNLVNASKTR